MTPHDDDRLLQDLLCGDASEHDPAVRARLASDPRLAARLAALRLAEQGLADLGTVTADLRDAAATLANADDRDRIARALRVPAPRLQGRARRARLVGFALVGLAAAALLVFTIAGGDHEPADGRLGGRAAVTVQQHGGGFRVAIADTLPPGTSYHLRLDLADGTSVAADGDAPTWQFPEAWNEAVRRARTGKLTIEWDDGTGLVVRHTLSLP